MNCRPALRTDEGKPVLDCLHDPRSSIVFVDWLLDWFLPILKIGKRTPFLVFYVDLAVLIASSIPEDLDRRKITSRSSGRVTS